MKKYIKEWNDSTIADTRVGEHGIVHMCLDDLSQGEKNKRQKVRAEEFIFEALYRKYINPVENKQI